MGVSWRKRFWISSFLFFWMAFPSFAFPPSSIEFAPGYKFPDSASNGAAAYQLRYFLYFPSWYLGAGIGVGSMSAKANNINLALDSNLTIRPVSFSLKFIPLQGRSFIPYLEVGIDHFAQLRYQLDPAVDTGVKNLCVEDPVTGFCPNVIGPGAKDFCTEDISTGPSPCKKTTFKRRHYGYHVGAGVETVFKSGIGLGVHYTYLYARPLERTIETTPDFGITPVSTLREDIFKIDESILSLLITYHFN